MVVSISTKFSNRMKNDTPITAKWSISKRKYNSNMADVCFSNPEVVISQP